MFTYTYARVLLSTDCPRAKSASAMRLLLACRKEEEKKKKKKRDRAGDAEYCRQKNVTRMFRTHLSTRRLWQIQVLLPVFQWRHLSCFGDGKLLWEAARRAAYFAGDLSGTGSVV